jgi:hypothetical protein
MALSPGALASIIQGNLAGVGANGANLGKFCSAVAAGVVMSIVGKPFATTDTGLVIGIGTGIGTGITGLDSSAMKSTAIGMMHSTGANAEKLMTAIMTGVVTHLGAAATLTSADAPVFLGSGSVIVGSITVVASEMGSNIYSQLQSMGAKGANAQELSMAIAGGICTNILSAGTGTVTITGTFTGPTPPGPIPGAGAGTGVIS